MASKKRTSRTRAPKKRQARAPKKLQARMPKQTETRTAKHVEARTPEQLAALETVRRLTLSAQAELEELLKRQEAGSISGPELNTGLAELLEHLKVIGMHEFEL